MNFHLQIFPKTVVDEVLPHSLSRIMYSARTIYCACATYFCCIFCLFLLMEVGWGGGSFGSFDQNKVFLLDPWWLVQTNVHFMWHL